MKIDSALRERDIQPSWPLVVGVMLMVLLEALDTTVVNVALPHMKGSFAATSDQITWMITAYLVSTAIVMPLTGYLVKKFGQREVLNFGVLGFIFASFACGLSTSLEAMVFFRFLQGGLGAVVVPISQSIMFRAFPEAKRSQAMSFWGIALMVGPLVGPVTGGWITENWSWPWIFFINIPLGLLALLLISGKLEPNVDKKNVSTDWFGLIMLSVTLGALQMVLDQGHTKDWFDSAFIWFLCWLTATGFALFILHALQTSESIVDIRLFGDKNFLVGNLLMAGYGMAMYSTIVLLPLQVQEVLGYPADTAGWILTPRGAVSAVLMIVVGTYLAPRVDGRLLMASGLILSFFSSYLMARFPLMLDMWGFIFPGIIMGIGMALVWSQLSVATFKTISTSKSSEAAGLFNVMRVMGGSVGIAITSTLLVRREQVHWNHLGQHIRLSNPELSQWFDHVGIDVTEANTYARLVEELTRHIQLAAFNDVFYFISFIFFVMIPLPFLLTPTRD